VTGSLACMVSVEAFVAAPPPELAAAVLMYGLGHTVNASGIGAVVETPQVVRGLAEALGIPQGRGYDAAIAAAPANQVPDAVVEGILFAEQRLCLVRSWSSGGTPMVRLLRRGRHALASGDPMLYLR